MENSTSNIIQSPVEFTRFVDASISIEVLFVIFIIFILVKEALQLVKQIESPVFKESSMNPYEMQATEENIEKKEEEGKAYQFVRRMQTIVHKFPLFAIFIINIVLFTTYQFMAISSYLCVIMLMVKQFLSKRLSVVKLVLGLIVLGLVIGSYINAFITVRLNNLDVYFYK